MRIKHLRSFHVITNVNRYIANVFFTENGRVWRTITIKKKTLKNLSKQEYVLWNAVSVPLLQSAQHCCRDHVTLATFLFRFFKWSCRDFLVSNLAKLEVRNFSHFGTITI